MKKSNTPPSHSLSRDHDDAAERPSVGAQIRAFLSGETNGAELLHAMYDEILAEPIPERMLALLRA